MYDGFFIKLPINRPLKDEERRMAMFREEDNQNPPRSSRSLMAFNSTYMDMMTPSMTWHGNLVSLILMSGCLFFLGMVGYSVIGALGYLGAVISPAVHLGIIPIALGGLCVPLFFLLHKELFTYKQFPIRFNRKTRKIYVFRNNGKHGVHEIPWEDAYFFIGEDRDDDGTFVYLRFHVLDGDQVKATYQVGIIVTNDHMDALDRLWQFIYLYMEKGPEALPKVCIAHPPKPSTWLSCFRTCYTRIGAGTVFLFYFNLPYVVVMTVYRWLILKTCRTAKWSAEVEAASQVAANDPYQAEAPKYFGDDFSEEPLPEGVDNASSRRRNSSDFKSPPDRDSLF